MAQIKKEHSVFIYAWLIKNKIMNNKEVRHENFIRHSGPLAWKIMLENEDTIAGFNSMVTEIRSHLTGRKKEFNDFLEQNAVLFAHQLKNKPVLIESDLRKLHELIGQNIPDIWNRLAKEVELSPNEVLREGLRLVNKQRENHIPKHNPDWSLIDDSLKKKKVFFAQPHLIRLLREIEKNPPSDQQIVKQILRKVDTGNTVIKKLEFGRKTDLSVLWDYIFNTIDPLKLTKKEKAEIKKLAMILI